MTTIIQYERTCYYCAEVLPASQTRYIARYDIDICNDCFMAYK